MSRARTAEVEGREGRVLSDGAGHMLRPRLADVVVCAQRRTNDRTIQSAARPRQHTLPLTVKPRSQK